MLYFFLSSFCDLSRHPLILAIESEFPGWTLSIDTHLIAVGYCQGFNMLAALILEVMDYKVHDSLKVMILLIEDVLPESYFANNLRGMCVP